MRSECDGGSYMLRKLGLLAAAFSFVWLALAETGNANVTRLVTWEDLMPEQVDLIDPFDSLNDDQRVELSVIIRAKRMLELDLINETNSVAKDAEAYRLKLDAQGVDIDWYIRADEDFRKQVEIERQKTVPELNGAEVRLAGFVLPLEYEDNAVTEMLLVPFVGACVHVPPPPPNQMVYVKLEKPFKSARLYTPVYITGKLSTEGDTKSIYLTDGQSDVQFGYSMVGAGIELYSQQQN